MALNPGTKTALAVAAGTIAAGLYFKEAERGIAKDANCTYMSPWTTDLAAWGAGATLIWLGYRHESWLISFMGAAIATLHVAQFAAHKVITRPTMNELLAGNIPVHDLTDVEAAHALAALEAA
jgi:urease accessory protein UreF